MLVYPHSVTQVKTYPASIRQTSVCSWMLGHTSRTPMHLCKADDNIMEATLANTRQIRIVTRFTVPAGQDLSTVDWQRGGELDFDVRDGFSAWTGLLPRAEYRDKWPRDGFQDDLSGFDDLVQLLEPIPREGLYPIFPKSGIRRYNITDHDKAGVYFKGPKSNHYRKGSSELALRLLNEAKVLEMLSQNPHPNIEAYLGCVADQGRIVRIALKKYKATFESKLDNVTTLHKYMDQIESAAAHLHSLGYAHMDISPQNIMIDDNGQAVLIDFDACLPFGETVTKAGLVTDWKGPLAGEGRQFKEASKECDELAIQAIRDHFEEKLATAEERERTI